MSKSLNQLFAISYLIAIFFYVSQGILFKGTWYTYLSGAYLLGYGLLCVFEVILMYRHSNVFGILVVFMLWVLFLWLLYPKYYFFQGKKVSTMTMIQYIIIVCSSVSTFYLFAFNRYISERLLKYFTLILACIFIHNILHYDVSTLGAGEYNFSSANNKSYQLAALSPFFLLFWKRKWLMLSLMVASMIFVVFLLKRGSMLCVLSFLLTTLYFTYKEKGALEKRQIRSILIKASVLILIGIIIYVLLTIYQENSAIQKRFDHGSQAREDIYSNILNVWYSSEFYLKLLGNGPLSTLALVRKYAHNDWLEILLDFGLIGLGLYVAVLFSIVRFYRRNNLTDLQKASLLVCPFYIVIRSTFSMCIYELESILVFGFMGYTMGIVNAANKVLQR